MEYRINVGEREERVKIEEWNNHYKVWIGEREYDVDAVRLGTSTSSTLSLLINGRSHEAEMVPRDFGYLVQLATRSLEVEVQHEVLAAAGPPRRRAAAAGRLEIQSPMPGLVIDVKASPGQRVNVGESLVVVEAMKMQNELPATVEAVVKEVKVEPGQTVASKRRSDASAASGSSSSATPCSTAISGAR
jgi:biotin carboxyl carrier protein